MINLTHDPEALRHRLYRGHSKDSAPFSLHGICPFSPYGTLSPLIPAPVSCKRLESTKDPQPISLISKNLKMKF